MSFCLQCGKENNNPKFCSRSCAAIYNNKKFVKRKRIEKICIVCGNSLPVRNKTFCSMTCIAKYKNEVIYNGYIKSWLNGENSGSKGKDGYQLSNHVRHYLLETNNYKCSICGWGEKNIFSGKIPLEIDHIDGDWKNNRPNNLRVVCPNCHSLTPTYRGANRKNGRGSKMRGSRLYRRLAEAV